MFKVFRTTLNISLQNCYSIFLDFAYVETNVFCLKIVITNIILLTAHGITNIRTCALNNYQYIFNTFSL
jgi:hypothetical protein